MPKARNVVQLVWGIALLLAGIGVFFRIPYVMPKVLKIEQFAEVIVFVRISFYLLGAVLAGSGAKKIFDYYNKDEDESANA